MHNHKQMHAVRCTQTHSHTHDIRTHVHMHTHILSLPYFFIFSPLFLPVGYNLKYEGSFIILSKTGSVPQWTPSLAPTSQGVDTHMVGLENGPKTL